MQYVHTIIGAALNSAVEGGVLKVNVAKRAHPPTAKEARAEEMKVWTPDEIAIFFAWAQDHMDRELRTAFQVLLASGMRRGELLALRWRDLDLNGGTVAVRRSVGTIKVKGRRPGDMRGRRRTAKTESSTSIRRPSIYSVNTASSEPVWRSSSARVRRSCSATKKGSIAYRRPSPDHSRTGLAGASGGRSSRPRSRASRRWRRSARSGLHDRPA